MQYQKEEQQKCFCKVVINKRPSTAFWSNAPKLHPNLEDIPLMLAVINTVMVVRTKQSIYLHGVNGVISQDSCSSTPHMCHHGMSHHWGHRNETVNKIDGTETRRIRFQPVTFSCRCTNLKRKCTKKEKNTFFSCFITF